jgi:hypothetical protein
MQEGGEVKWAAGFSPHRPQVERGSEVRGGCMLRNVRIRHEHQEEQRHKNGLESGQVEEERGRERCASCR